MTEFEPKIIGFLCNWCAYAGADLAGVSRIQYPTNLRAIRVMCSGRVDPVIVLETFAQGADGVLVMGCHPGDCHYMDGNYQAERKVKMLKKLIALTGLEAERLSLEWVSAAEGERFANIVRAFTNQIRSLGPSPLTGQKPDASVLTNILAAKAAVEDFRLRVLVGRERKIVEEENAYGEKVEQEEFDKTEDESILDEYNRNRIYLLVKNKPLSVKDLCKRLNLESRAVLQHIVVLRSRGLVALDRVEGTSPLYAALRV